MKFSSERRRLLNEYRTQHKRSRFVQEEGKSKSHSSARQRSHEADAHGGGDDGVEDERAQPLTHTGRPLELAMTDDWVEDEDGEELSFAREQHLGTLYSFSRILGIILYWLS